MGTNSISELISFNGTVPDMSQGTECCKVTFFGYSQSAGLNLHVHKCPESSILGHRQIIYKDEHH